MAEQSTQLPTPDPQPPLLAPADRAVLTAIARALVEDGDGWPTVDAVGAVALSEQMLATLPPAVQAQFRLALRFVEWGAVVLAGRGRRFTQLDPVDRRAYLASWAQSRLPMRRLIFRSLQTVVAVGYYSAEPVRARLLGREEPRS